MKAQYIFFLFIILMMSSCLKEDDLKRPYQTFSPGELDDGWNVSTPLLEGIEEDGLTQVFRYVHSDKELWQIRSLIVVRNGKLVAESYMKDPSDITHPSAVWSCTKQVVGLLAGIALDKGYISSANDEISEYLPEVAGYPEKASVTLDDLLTMRSGIRFENDGFNGNSAQLLRQIPSNSLEYVLGLDLFHPHGTIFNYNDGDPQLVSAVLQQQTGKTLKKWADEVLFSKLGICNWDWVIYKDGITMGAFGILTTPRELAKIGQLILNDGWWNGTRIVSKEWLVKMTTPLVESHLTGQNKAFGYYWWIDTERDIAFMYGHGGQYVFVDCDRDLIVVITSEPNTQGGFMLSLDRGLDIYDRIVKCMN